MKEFKSFVIGFLTCACLFLIMGQTDGYEPHEYDAIYSRLMVRELVVDDIKTTSIFMKDDDGNYTKWTNPVSAPPEKIIEK